MLIFYLRRRSWRQDEGRRGPGRHEGAGQGRRGWRQTLLEGGTNNNVFTEICKSSEAGIYLLPRPRHLSILLVINIVLILKCASFNVKIYVTYFSRDENDGSGRKLGE